MLQKFPEQTGKVYAFGLTYPEHIAELGEKSAEPVIFYKSCQPDIEPTVVVMPRHQQVRAALAEMDAVIAHAMAAVFPQMPVLLDYEVEVGMVLLESVMAEQLLDGSFMPRYGLFLANDITARSVQFAGEMSDDRVEYWAKSKSFAGFLPVSSQMLETQEGESFPDWTLQLSVNGQLRQSGKLASVILSPRQFVERALLFSGGRKLVQGDVIMTGTPSGVAASVAKWKRVLASFISGYWRARLAIKSAMKNPAHLRSGDEVETKLVGSELPDLSFRID